MRSAKNNDIIMMTFALIVSRIGQYGKYHLDLDG